MEYAVYSLADVHVVFNHPDVGRMVLSDSGRGRIVIAMAGDMTSHTVTAGGFVVVNRIPVHSGNVTLDLPQNSDADKFLDKWCTFVNNTQDSTRAALATLSVVDKASNRSWHCSGVTPQKDPDRTYDQTAGTVPFTLACAVIKKQ